MTFLCFVRNLLATAPEPVPSLSLQLQLQSLSVLTKVGPDPCACKPFGRACSSLAKSGGQASSYRLLALAQSSVDLPSTPLLSLFLPLTSSHQLSSHLPNPQPPRGVQPEPGHQVQYSSKFEYREHVEFDTACFQGHGACLVLACNSR